MRGWLILCGCSRIAVEYIALETRLNPVSVNFVFKYSCGCLICCSICLNKHVCYCMHVCVRMCGCVKTCCRFSFRGLWRWAVVCWLDVTKSVIVLIDCWIHQCFFVVERLRICTGFSNRMAVAFEAL